MSLDLTRIVSQVADMVAHLRAGGRQHARHLDRAREALDGVDDAEGLRQKIAASNTTWLVAGPVAGLDERQAPPPLPADFTVMACDGSHIDVDRHRSMRCYLINIGSVVLRYGADADAFLESLPRLYAGDEDLVIAAPGVPGREQPIEGALLGIKRGVDECRRLSELAAASETDRPTLALLDGTLILWNLEAYPDFVGEKLLEQGFLGSLESLRQSARERPLALASYISFPRSTDFVNALKVAVCPREAVDSDRCPSCQTRECDDLSRVRDRDLFGGLLEPGERSAVFVSSSRIQRRYGPHRVHFFYLNVADEIGRVEVPEWVAADDGRLSLAHGLILDQCRRGHGYPVVLSEAHEKAVVTGADADGFWRLVEAALADERLPAAGSAKSWSKRTRWV